MQARSAGIRDGVARRPRISLRFIRATTNYKPGGPFNSTAAKCTPIVGRVLTRRLSVRFTRSMLQARAARSPDASAQRWNPGWVAGRPPDFAALPPGCDELRIRRPLQFDRVAFRILKVNGRPLAFRAVAPADLADLHGVRFQVRDDRRLVPAFDAQAEVIHVARLAARCRPAL